MTSVNLLFLLVNIIMFSVFSAPLKELISSSFQNDLYSHIVLIPAVSAYLIISKRKEIFSDVRYSFAAGALFMAAGILLYFIGVDRQVELSRNDYLSLVILSTLITWVGGFVFFYGIQAAKKAAFPLLFLIFMVPIPGIVVEKITSILQRSSAEAANWIFALTGVPFLREGNTFHLPSLSVEVASQCSGIRSSLALFITSVLAGHLFLKTGWKRVVLVLSVFPVTILKNGLRIVTLSLLGAYVDERFLSGTLHQQGGIPFFLLALLLWAPLLWLLRKSEKRVGSGDGD